MNNELATYIIDIFGSMPYEVDYFFIKKAIYKEYTTLSSVDLHDLKSTFEAVMDRLVDNKKNQDYINKAQEILNEVISDLGENHV